MFYIRTRRSASSSSLLFFSVHGLRMPIFTLPINYAVPDAPTTRNIFTPFFGAPKEGSAQSERRQSHALTHPDSHLPNPGRQAMHPLLFLKFRSMQLARTVNAHELSRLPSINYHDLQSYCSGGALQCIYIAVSRTRLISIQL
jgi:hypothetical protein